MSRSLLRRSRYAALAAATLVCLAGCATNGEAPATRPATQPVGMSRTERPAPLFDNLGKFHRKVSTDSTMAQRYFDQGLILCYAFSHDEALRSFEAAAALDPNCAMGHWGIAYALAPNINKPMPPEAAARAYEASQKALSLSDRATPVERDLIAALAKRYAAQPPADRSALDRAYADAMRQVYQRHSTDVDVAVLFADAMMNTMPWRYWTLEGQPQPGTGEILSALESALARDFEHAGAHHLYIHAIEAGPEPEKGLPSADRLRDLCPGGGHLVHMPSHIYLRVGQYQLASRSNELAIEVDKDYEAQCAAQGYYPKAYVPHNMHFLWYSTAMEGRSRDSFQAAGQTTAHVCVHTDAAEVMRQKPLTLLTLLWFSKWDELLKQPAPPADELFGTAMYHYCRGVALAHKGQLDEARAEQTKLDAFVDREESKKLNDPFFPGYEILRVAQHELAGQIARHAKDFPSAEKELTQAVQIEDALPYMEPPYWHRPVRLVLGATLLEADRPGDAEKVYREDLRRRPATGWALSGLSRSLKAQGKADVATEVDRQFREAWARGDADPVQ